MSVLSDIKSELERLAGVAGSADQPDRLAEASRSLPERVRGLLADLADEFTALRPPEPAAEPEPPVELAADAEPPAGDTPPDNPEAVG